MLSTRAFGSACAVTVFVCLMAATVSTQVASPDTKPVGSTGTGASPTAPQGATYQWLGELVSADTAASTLTVKARVAYAEAISELKQFKPGEQVWVVWSGLHDYSDAIRQLRRVQTGSRIAEAFVLPAELVTPEAANQYATIRMKVPADTLSAIKAVKPGEWITVTSRHRPSADAEAIVAVRPYNSGTH